MSITRTKYHWNRNGNRLELTGKTVEKDTPTKVAQIVVQSVLQNAFYYDLKQEWPDLTEREAGKVASQIAILVERIENRYLTKALDELD